MKAICFMQEVKEGDLTIREQMLVCRRALRKLRWPCVLELFAQAGTEEQPLSLRPGMVELLHAAANGEADVLVVVDGGLGKSCSSNEYFRGKGCHPLCGAGACACCGWRYAD